MDRADFEQLKQFLKENISIQCTSKGSLTNPNGRTVSLYLEGEEISSAHFDVVQQREYEG